METAETNHFDYDQELQFGSSFHRFLLEEIRENLIPRLKERVGSAQIPEFEDSFDGGKAVGVIEFGVEEISVEELVIPLDNIHVSFSDPTIVIVWNNVSASLRRFQWFYRKNVFPRIKDNGSANASISKGIVCITLGIDRAESGPKFSLLSSAVKIGSLDVKISGSMIRVLYNLLLSAFSRSMKVKVQEQLQIHCSDLFTSYADTLLSDFHNRYQANRRDET